eukprot:Rhum_TRINITY_DN14790_c11_g1::Rhum_TRINITY_DN14790_c11_g1_i1::g.118089::m.118089
MPAQDANNIESLEDVVKQLGDGLDSLLCMVDRGLSGQPLETPRVNLKSVPALSTAAAAAAEPASAAAAAATAAEPTRKVRGSRVRSKSETPHAAAAATPSDDRRPRAAAARRHSRVHHTAKEPAGGVFTRLYNHTDTAKHNRPRDPHASTPAARHASGSAANAAARDGSRGDARTRASRHGATSMSPEVARRRAYPVAVGGGGGGGGSGVGPTTVAFGL